MSTSNSPEIKKMKSTTSSGRWSFSGLWKGKGVNGRSKNEKGQNVPKRSSSLSSPNGRPNLLRSQSSDISQPELFKRTASVSGFIYRDPDSSDEETEYVPSYVPQKRVIADPYIRSQAGLIRKPLERTQSLTRPDFQDKQRSSNGRQLSRSGSIDSNSDLVRPHSSSGFSRDRSIARQCNEMQLDGALSRSRLNHPSDISRSSSRSRLNPSYEPSRNPSRSRSDTSSRPGSFVYPDGRQRMDPAELRKKSREEMENAFGKVRLSSRVDYSSSSRLRFQRSNSRLRSERVFGQVNESESDALDLTGLPSITESSPVKPTFPE
ncbi:hypothetical protein DFH28DRAFT_1145358 [Melampsora americana]|nr:hypothetical protein DFH28DRAFT_1145358 [Melampsora americana]